MSAVMKRTPLLELLQWPDETAVILASGQSLSDAQVEAVKLWHSAGRGRVIAVNTTFRRAPWADVLYACDGQWWQVYHAEAETTFRGALWTQDMTARRHYAINRVESVIKPGLGKTPGVIHQGGNGGYQAINLAYQAGVARIVLLGFDMHGTHWHGKYSNGLPNTAPHLFKSWISGFDALAADLLKEGVEVINCAPGSRLTCFPTADLMGVLA